MASLYKRYIPPKSIPDQPEVSGSVSRPENPPAPPKPIETKRKRERSQEEVAERKAKKLKKKGIDPATVEQSKPVPIAKDGEENRDVGPNIQTEVHETEVKETASIAPHGEFSHVNSVRKRRKLEKEARAARKAIAKAQNASKHQEVVDDGASSLGDSMAIDEAKSTEHPVPEKTVSTRSVEDETEDGASEARKRNKQQKDVPQEDDHKNHVHDANEAELPAVKPKKRRHKLEAVFADTTVGEAVTVGNDQHLQKHVNVLDKFQKSVNRSSQRPEETHEEEEIRPSQTIVKDLELPEPEDEPMPEFTSVDETLPPWLAKPTVVSAENKATFQDLGLDNEITGRLAKLGFSTALPVQQALVPLLLRPGISGSMFPPGTETVLPDVAVNAPTGSGKTIAYLLPIIESLRQSQYRGRLGALVVVPTRELVLQVAAVAESLAKGHGLKVGMSTGTGKFRDEQERLIKGSIRYDPAEYSKLMQKAKYQINPPDEDSEDFEEYLAEIGLADSREELRLDDAVNCLVEHVPTYESAIDILVATPGRLSEHLNNTLGFTLVHVQWLVIDEADKLLDHEHREFLESLHTELTRAKRSDEQDAREKYLRQQGLWDEREERQLRKVVLSATMTKDISKLASLRLQRPQLVVVRGAESQAVVGAAYDGRNEGLTGDGFELPPTLTEYCVPVGDGSEKPLVAVELIASRIFKEVNWMRRMANPLKTDNRADSPDDEDASSVSDESSILSSDDSTSSSDTDSSTDPSDDETSNDEKDQPESPFSKRVRESTQQPAETSSSKAATVLIFTSSNESASRLAHLLKTLKPDWSPRITTLVKSKQGSARIRCKLDEPAIVISTDRAARGLDSFSDQKGAKRLITHVLQYDVPRSITSYVHRVGRTARAGNKGDAWTLYTHAEARWFVNEIIKPETVKRAGMVERIKLFMANDELRQRYGKILAEMKEEVVGGGGT